MQVPPPAPYRSVVQSAASRFPSPLISVRIRADLPNILTVPECAGRTLPCHGRRTGSTPVGIAILPGTLYRYGGHSLKVHVEGSTPSLAANIGKMLSL